ncbi:hypothetical protein DEH69_10485 [Streptomyces sp. PT12]|nr:hypothetical protein DEH69_10485 [Streptomyces sp. PT12]
MQGVINGYRLATALIPDAKRSDDLFLRALNAQLCLSYLASGLAKLVSSDWRSGRAMELIMRTNTYGNTSFARFIISHPDIGRLISWATIAGEVAYPVVYVADPRIARHGLTLAKLFHLVVAYTMGLPRFFWTFGATHPSAHYVIGQRTENAS